MEDPKLQENKDTVPAKKPLIPWVAGVEMFSRVSTWIVVPVVAALIFGKMLDKKFGTAPVIFLTLTSLGFLITVYGIIKIVKEYTKENK